MQDRPTVPELVEAVREFLASEVVPALGDRGLRYGVAIALHLLGIVEREARGEEARLRDELAALRELLGAPGEAATAEGDLAEQVREANSALCARIRAGEADGGAWGARVLERVTALVEAKLATSSPERLAMLREAGDG